MDFGGGVELRDSVFKFETASEVDQVIGGELVFVGLNEFFHRVGGCSGSCCSYVGSELCISCGVQ